jgi:hypothetical protein
VRSAGAPPLAMASTMRGDTKASGISRDIEDDKQKATASGDLNGNGIKYAEQKFLDIRSRDAGDAARFVLALLQHRLRDIVAVTHALLVGVARAHQVAAIVEEKTREEGRRARPPHLTSDRPILERVLWQKSPALMGLALDVGLTGFTLGIERRRGRGYARSIFACRWRSAAASGSPSS